MRRARYEKLLREGLIDRRWRPIAEHARPWELYDLATDPTELRDRAPHRPEMVRALRER